MDQKYSNLLNLINALKATVEGLGGGTELNTTKYKIIGLGSNLADYIGEYISGGSFARTGTCKVKIKLILSTIGNVTVDLKLVDSVEATHTYNGKSTGYGTFESLNAEASVNLTSGTTEYTFLDNVIIDLEAGNNQLMFKVNNTNLVDDMYVEISTEPVNQTEFGWQLVIPAGI